MRSLDSIHRRLVYLRLNSVPFYKKLEEQTELSFLSLRSKLTPKFWLVVLIANLAAWGFEQYYADAKFNTLYFRLAVCAFALPLFSSPYPRIRFLASIQTLYFAVFMFLLLPVMFSWNALANASFADTKGNLSGAWLTEYALAVFIFLGLFSKPAFALFLSSIALLSTTSIAFLVFEPTTDAFLGTILFLIATMITAFCFMLTTHQQLNYVLQHRLETAYSIGSRVAHELRTPLLSIKNFAATTKKALKDGKPNQQEKVIANLDHILREIEFSNRTIDILLVSTSKAAINVKAVGTFRAKSVIENAVASYPYSNPAERASVHIAETTDFEATGPYELLVHALYNLIKNALLSAESYSDSKIELECFSAGGKGTIVVKDNGPGIPLRLQHKVFDDFFTTRSPGEGTGLGLAFCKSLMNQLGGTITYKRADSTSIFRMSFPLQEP